MFSNPIVMIALASGLLFVMGKLMAKGDTAVEERRRGAMTLLVDAEKAGLGFLSPMLQDYAVGDYSGLIKEVGKLRDGLHDAERRRTALRTFLEKQFEIHAGDAEGRKLLEDMVIKYIPDADILAFAEKVKAAQEKELANAPGTTS